MPQPKRKTRRLEFSDDDDDEEIAMQEMIEKKKKIMNAARKAQAHTRFEDNMDDDIKPRKARLSTPDVVIVEAKKSTHHPFTHGAGR